MNARTAGPIAAAMLTVMAPAGEAAAHGSWSAPEAVAIEGYTDHAMEPFITCDGQILMFNNRNGDGDKTDIHWAERVTDAKFRYRGKIANANSDALDGVPTIDCQGNLYFISTRTYFDTRSTIYQAKFENGTARDVKLVPGLATREVGILNFDVEVTPAGDALIVAEGTYNMLGGPWSADLFLAERAGDGFSKSPRSAALFANVNTDEREYAAALSHDGLELFFTRLSGWSIWPTLTIEHATRESTSAAWSASAAIASISGFVEAPSITRDGKTLYFHRKMDDGTHRLFLVRRQ